MNNLRKRFVLSLLSLLMCISMFAGSTFAWFTESVTSGNNVIVSGNLDVEMYWTDTLNGDQTVWTNVEESDKGIFVSDNWEPGYTEIKYVKVVNKGNLAFKYQFNLLSLGEMGILADVIDVYHAQLEKGTTVSPFVNRLDVNENMLKSDLVLAEMANNYVTFNEGVVLPANAQDNTYYCGETVIAVALHMQETAGNKYQEQSLGDGFGIQVLATQYGYESDGFGNDYDNNVEFPKNFLPVSISKDVTELVENDLLKEEVAIRGPYGISVTMPTGTKVNSQQNPVLTLTVKEKEISDANVKVGENEELKAFDVHVEGIALDNTVPMVVKMGKVLPTGLNKGNLKIYHVEDGTSKAMTEVNNVEDFNAHNQFVYEPLDGSLTLYMASFSEVAVLADETAAWEGNFDYSWYTNSVNRTTDADYVIANADQLAAFGAIVGGMDGQTKDSFSGKTVKLSSNINLGDVEAENNPDLIFYPIGYYNNEGTYERTGKAIESSVSSFEGIFDGNGHKISNFYQNTWEMKGDDPYYAATEQYYNDAMGLFGYVKGGTVKNLTVDNFSSDGEYTPTGVIAAYADGDSNFENIAITNCNPRVYNTGNGGIIGIAGNTSSSNDDHITLKNITIDNTNKISALWGSWDVACGGLVGMYRGNVDGSGNPTDDTISFTNCHVAAQIDVYNDVCANYQYYAYRYAGMIIGSVRHNTTNDDGKTIPNMTGISASSCTVNYGDWNDYYYCEFEENTMASYSDDYQFSRVPNTEIDTTNGKENATCIGHDHTKAEDKRAVYLPFHQLFTGYSWGVNSIGLKEYSGIVTDLGITEGDQEESVEKFTTKLNLDSKLEANISYTIDSLFAAIDDKKINGSAVQVAVSGLNNSGITAEYEANTENWKQGKLTFNKIEGMCIVTIQDYNFCKPTTILLKDGKLHSVFESKFNGSFTYRVGNKGSISLGTLFAEKDILIDDSKVKVEVIGTNANGKYIANSSEWEKGIIEFTGTGSVKVRIQDTNYSNVTELNLQVVDAVNVTSATSATKNNVVLLNDCGFSSLEVSNGYTLYGNGFTMTCSSDSAALDMGYSFVTLNNGTLDNVQIVCPNFDYAALYKSNLTSSDNRSETTDKTRYYNAKSGVMVSGNSQILNSRISGGRASLNVSGGNIIVDNSRIELGAVANILVGSANSLTLRDTTLIQKPTASTYDSNKTLMGFSVLYLCDSEGKATPTTLEGSFVQQAWVNADDKQYVPSAGQDIVDGVMKETTFIHKINGEDSLNLGFAYMPEDAQKTVAAPDNITDNRTDKETIPYEMKDVKIQIAILSTTVYVYSYKNTNGTADDFKTENKYQPDKYSDIIAVSYTDTTEGLTAGKSYGTDGWVYELNVDLDKASGYKLDFSKMSMSVNGETVDDFKVNGSDKPDSPVSVTAGGTVYTLTATIDGKKYTATYKVTGTETSKESPSLVGTPSYGAGFGVANKYGGDWSAAAPVLDGITIKYWSVADSEYKEFALSSITFANTGKQNGTNNYWEYTHTNNDFTLKLTNTAVIHSSSGTYGMPVAGKDGKLYFTIASSGGFVSTGTTSRSIKIEYEFTDNNGGDTLKFSNTWSIPYSKDEQYNYSSFTSDGTLTPLEAGSSSGGGTCLAEGTLITLADGTKRAVEDLRKGDSVMAFDHVTGEITNKNVIIVVKTQSDFHENTFVFSDGTRMVTINEHGLYDLDLNKYVNIDHKNANDYIGHSFVSVDTKGNIGTKKLVKVISKEDTGYKYDIVTEGTLNYVAEDTLSVTHVLVDIINTFDFNDSMMYDQVKMQSDIKKYGLYTYDEWKNNCDISVYKEYNIPVMKVGVSKGLYTRDYITYLINTYVLDESKQIIE